VAAVWSKRKTPWVASLILLAVALALLPLGKIETVAGVSSLATMLAFFGINAALIALRKNHPRKERPFCVPLAIGKIPVLPVCGALVSLIFLTQFDATVYLAGGGFLLVAAAIFYFTEKPNR
jgi:APA family basic amino acid/polyamine antiporter